MEDLALQNLLGKHPWICVDYVNAELCLRLLESLSIVDKQTAVKGLKHLKSFLEELPEFIENGDPTDFAMGLYNWSEDPISFTKALDIAIEELSHE